MDEPRRSSSSATVVIVGIVAVLAIVLLVSFAFLRDDGESAGADIDVNIDPGGAIEEVIPDAE